ncbi:hypothetical protein [Bacillus nitratireducens]|uniref:hypothetical protein n=1 Tax=Bacillus nitratireducens TaxID=2026193 RepID=UPI000BEC198A|nr:hypothetical protein [Bacillus nitratireducens]PEE17127.1 hypothetical protein CON53_12220 [Bacillus cereus]MED0903408.1 hypothetical protein [Bacillus nitratireducens]PFH92940.1 hypothetical protein COI81_04485 [Bacillus cereus]PFM58520.1 hypothetical protein COJ52_15685 [Bacillus cereus]PGS27897.1 hypothetical protein COC55_11340 [Bacillus cereus]
MEKLPEMKKFLEELKTDNAVVFDLQKVSLFERELYLSIQSVLSKEYNIRLGGLTNRHHIEFLENLNNRNVVIESDIKRLVDASFKIYDIICKRNESLGYGPTKSKNNVDNENVILLVNSISSYIEQFETIS